MLGWLDKLLSLTAWADYQAEEKKSEPQATVEKPVVAQENDNTYPLW